MSHPFVVQIDQPLCIECANRVHEEAEGRIREVQEEITAYEAALARLASQDVQPLSEQVSICR